MRTGLRQRVQVLSRFFNPQRANQAGAPGPGVLGYPGGPTIQGMGGHDGRGWWVNPKALGTVAEWAGKAADRLSKRESPEQRLKRMESALAMQIRIFGPDGGPTARARAAVAEQLEGMGRLTEAQLLRQAVLNANRRHLGDEHPHTLIAEGWLAINLRDQGLGEAARPLFKHVYEVRRRTLGPGDQQTVQAERYLASVDDDGAT
jgi:hypothetical protein